MVSVELLPDGWDVLSETRGAIPEVQTLGVSEYGPHVGQYEDYRAPPYGTLPQGTETINLTWKADLEAE